MYFNLYPLGPSFVPYIGELFTVKNFWFLSCHFYSNFNFRITTFFPHIFGCPPRSRKTLPLRLKHRDKNKIWLLEPSIPLLHSLYLAGTGKDRRRSPHGEGALDQESRSLHFDPRFANNGVADHHLEGHVQPRFVIIYWEQVIPLVWGSDTSPTWWCGGAIPFLAR